LEGVFDLLAEQAAKLLNGAGGTPPVAACEGMTLELS
jgi:hypothetical protein